MADGRLNFDTKINTDGFENGIGELSAELKKLTASVRSLSVITAQAFRVQVTADTSEALAAVTQIERLSIPDKTVKVEADTGSAESEIKSVGEKPYNVDISVNADTAGADAAIDRTAEGHYAAEISVNADTEPAETAVNWFENEVSDVSVTVYADTSPAESAAESMEGSLPDAEITVGADTSSAEAGISGVGDDAPEVTVPVDADTSSAEEAAAGLKERIVGLYERAAAALRAKLAQLKRKSAEPGATFGDSFGKGSKRAKNAVSQVDSGLDRLKSKLKGLAGAAAAAFGIRQIVSFGKSAKEAYEAQIEAETQLGQVMRRNTGATEEQIQAAKELASQLQQAGVIGDEIQLAGLQELGTYVSNADSLKRMNAVLNDMLAQQYGLNATAESSANVAAMLGKVLEGQTSALSRYGYSFTEAQEKLLKYGTEEQRVAVLAEVVESSVGGMNEALARTPSGRLKQVANTLGDIKERFGEAATNLLTILLPAIERAVSALQKLADAAVRVTSALASAFGVELKNSTAVGGSISDSVAAEEELKSAVEETAEAQENALAGFDKMNILQSPEKPETAEETEKEPEETRSVAVVPVISDNGIDKAADVLSEKLSKLLELVRLAWDANSGQLIEQAEFAVDSVKALIGSIAGSWWEVWQNGSGERLVGDFITLLSDVLRIIGEIASAFRTAWESDGNGTALIQAIFSALSGILELCHEIGAAWSEAWNDGTGVEICTLIIGIITDIVNTVGALAGQLKKAWSAGSGKRIMSAVLAVIRSILTTVKKLSGATLEWAKNLDFEPLLESIAGLFEKLAPLADSVGGALVWVYKNVLLPLASWTIEAAVPAAVDLFAAALEVLTAVIEALKPLAVWLWENFLAPLAEWTGELIISAIQAITEKLSAFADWIGEHQTLIETLIIILGSFAAAFAAVGAAMNIVEIIMGVVAALSLLGEKLLALFAFAASPVGIAVAVIGALIAVIVLLIKHWDTVKEHAIMFAESVCETMYAFYDKVVEIFTKVRTFLSGIWDAIKRIFAAVGDYFRDRFSEAWESVKAVFTGVADFFLDKFSAAWENIKAVFADPAAFFRGVWEAVKGCFSKVSDWFRDTFSEAWEKVKGVFTRGGEVFHGITESIADTFKTVVNSLIDGINNVISVPFNVINGAFDTLRSWELWTIWGEFVPFSWLPNLDVPQIPHLAQGTAVPANYGEFLAVLGDNKRETEIVSPVSEIKRAVREVLAENRGGGGRTIEVVCVLDGREIGRAAVKAVEDEQTRRGR